MFIDLARQLAEAYNSGFQRLHQASSLAWWQTVVGGGPGVERGLAEAQYALREFHADPRIFEQIQDALIENWDDPLLARQLQLIYNRCAECQVDRGLLRRISEAEADLLALHGGFRARIADRVASENEIREILRNSGDEELRRAAWAASLRIGKQAAPRLLELVRLRNDSARALGFSDYYHMRLSLSEVDQESLGAVLNALETRTDGPAEAGQAELVEELSARCGVSHGRLRPWQGNDPFFQETPDPAGLDLDRCYSGQRPRELALDFFDSLGLEMRGILAASDLEERNGKCQSAFCVNVDLDGDVRVLCNLKPDEYWMSALLHELGHAAYDLFTDYEQPFILRGPAHDLAAEAVALLLERSSRDPLWLERFTGAAREDLERLRLLIGCARKRRLLHFTRWALVVIRFERELYRDPGRDLGALWWILVERYQGIEADPERDPSTDWACKSHLAASPVYYHNYLLGEILACQFDEALKAAVGPEGFCAGPAAGGWLADRIFQPANTLHWSSLVEQATGYPLSVEDFAGRLEE